MTPADTAVGPTLAQRWRGARWVLLALVVIIGVAWLSTYLTAPRPGGPMDPESTSPEGARALVTILREHGVDVIAAGDIAAVESAARPDTLILVAQTFYLFDDELLRRLAALPGDRLLVAPVSRTREELAPRDPPRAAPPLSVTASPIATCGRRRARAMCGSASATRTRRSATCR